ncbi:MAG: hypothetical protein B7Z73_05480 [Planctomycetia bacterium 21-64-5]|nr:MAG: hypothetical protein B7Z73_05480 [Planctomycetia bacterium 21-64-5]HQU42128.1 hypothetical protein [Pirellulales bacterium]
MGFTPNIALNAVSANVSSPTTVLGAFRSKLSLQVVTSGTLSAGTVALQGSLDGQTFDSANPLASWVAGTDASGALKFVVDKPTYAYRCVVTGFSGAGSLTATVGVDARG